MENREILVKFREAPDYRKVGATGVWGGITPTGQVLCNFFIEFHEIPDELKHAIQPDGTMVPALEMQSMPTIIRELQIGVLFPPHIVRSIGEWFINQSEVLTQMMQPNTPETD